MANLIAERLIVALDVDNLEEAKRLVDILYPNVKIFKVGSQLFTACGPEAVRMIVKKGAKVFLDLKFHDIPNTVKKAIVSAAKLKVYMLTVHLSGGKDMLGAAVSIADRPKIIGVSVLTSESKEDTKDKVLNLAKLAKAAGLDGVVCSAQETNMIREACGKDFIIVTPGIRPEGYVIDDQVRITTPKEAVKAGADFIVVGRPIIKAENPKEAAVKILKDIE